MVTHSADVPLSLLKDIRTVSTGEAGKLDPEWHNFHPLDHLDSSLQSPQSSGHQGLSVVVADDDPATNPPSPAPHQPACEKLEGWRVLLAEDNVVSQRLMRRMLEKEGCRVVVANTGREALAVLAQQSFDLVLMDVQMPDLNGLETTATIRAQEQGGATHLPIIALTARAMQEDRQRCLAAGMDAYLSKPLQATTLYATLNQLAGHNSAAQTMTTAPPVNFSAAMHLVNGDRQLLAELVDLLIGELPQQLSRLRQAISGDNAAVVEMIAHTLKGAISHFEAQIAYSLIHEIEILGRQGAPAEAAEILPRLERELERLITFLAKSDWNASL